MSQNPALWQAAFDGGELVQLANWQALRGLGFQSGSGAAGKWRRVAHSW
jgi:hypothetical protein